MQDLETFASQFKEWRGNKYHRRYPKSFWEQIRQFAKNYSLAVIAQMLGISLPYLRLKLQQNSKSLKFATLNVSSCALPISIEFIDRNSCPMTVRCQVNQEQLAAMILSLSRQSQ